MNYFKNKSRLLVPIALCFSTIIFSQQLEYQNTFDELPVGIYGVDQAKEAFNVSFFKGAEEGRVAVTEFQNKGNVLRALYPKGKVKTNNSGFHTKLFWDKDGNEKHEELYLSYNIYIPEDFEFRAGAKIPGLAYQTKDRNMSVRLMWRRDGRLEYYNHFNTRPIWQGWSASVDWSFTGPYSDLVNGEVQADQAKLIKGQWNHIELYNKLNTPGESDGVMRAWLNGKLALDITDNEDYRQADEGDIALNCIYLSTFFGGSDETYQPTKDQYAYFDDFKISKTRIGFNGEITDPINEEEIEEEVVEEEVIEEEVEIIEEENTINTCEFGTPSAIAIPSLNRVTYNNVHVLGQGGPDVSTIRRFRINWNSSANRLYQFAVNTTNGIPSHYVNLMSSMNFKFNTANPEVTLTGTGLSGWDGAYWVAIDGANFVMVSKNRGFTIYFNNGNAPVCNELSLKNISNTSNLTVSSKIGLYPNPAKETINIQGLSTIVNKVSVVDMNGKIVLNATINNNNKVAIASLAPGYYFLKILNLESQKVIPFIKTK